MDIARFLTEADAALASADRDRCNRAADLYTGEPLPADRYEPWAAEARERVRQRLLAVLKGAGRWDRVLDIDPTDEQSHRELMTSYLSAGQRRDAIRQFERVRDALGEHMGVGPDPETIAVYQRVLAWEGEQHLADAERIAGLWQGGPYNAAAWEARAAVRAAEGNAGEAAALLREAADEYARCGRRPDEQRCRAALLNAVPA